MNNATDFVIFGGTGDLTLRKLLPALYRAFNENNINSKTHIYLTCRNQNDIDNYLNKAYDFLVSQLNQNEFEETIWKKFSQMLKPILLDIKGDGWDNLKNALRPIHKTERVFYFAIAPALYAECCEQLNKYQLNPVESRVVVEKPIGYDRQSAQTINTAIGHFFSENQIFRIDHYLGKETVQNLLVLRFSNLLFENMWDHRSIDHIQISISETVGLEGRAGFYNEAGALRDMVQNHLLQLLCLVAMEPPNKLNSDSLRTEKLKVLQSLRPITQDNIHEESVRGQYISGNINSTQVAGYLEELKREKSFCETFVALRAHVDNWRWKEVPFYLRTGKRLKERCAEVIVQFKSVSHNIYAKSQGIIQPNRLVILIQPNEKIQLQLNCKNLAETETQLKPATLDLNLNTSSNSFQSDAYKRLILDVLANDPSLFIHREEIDHAWAWVDPIIEAWKITDYQPELYSAGTWGPEAADKLLSQDSRSWHNAQDLSSETQQ